jgi:RNA polymerase sigma factor (sigma-70 family)
VAASAPWCDRELDPAFAAIQGDSQRAIALMKGYSCGTCSGRRGDRRATGRIRVATVDSRVGHPDTSDDAGFMAASIEQPEAFAVVYDRHAASLYHYARRRLGADLAEDVVADAMLTAFRKREHYDTTSPDARPWLFGILTREISRRRRDERARFRALARLGPSDHTDLGAIDQVTAAIVAGAARGPLAEALAALASRDRDVLLLVAWADLSYQEVADALHVPIGTVRSRLNRARRRVRAVMPAHADLLDMEDTR